MLEATCPLEEEGKDKCAVLAEDTAVVGKCAAQERTCPLESAGQPSQAGETELMKKLLSSRGCRSRGPGGKVQVESALCTHGGSERVAPRKGRLSQVL